MSEFNTRYLAQVLVEAETPLNISSGEHDALTDSVVMCDANGLPMIPGASLCGVLRHSLAEETKTKQIIHDIKNNPVSFIDDIFGYQGKDNDGRGSRLIVSNAHFIGLDGVIEGLKKVDWDDIFYSKFAELPIREHCKISHKGASDALEHGKFDNQVIYKGARFKFELELIGNDADSGNWNKLLNLLSSDSFRIGGGTRKGYGKLKIISAITAKFNFSDPSEPLQMNNYLNKSPRLSDKLVGKEIKEKLTSNSTDYIKYELELKPDDFYSFGSGFGDDEVDMTPVYEEVIEWKNDIPSFSKKKILIPASSVKGAISHRVAFHYNKLTGVFADNLSKEEIKKCTGENNNAVKALFGFAKDSESEDNGTSGGQKGNVIFSDVFEDKEKTKILNHVAIDRFTGGAMDGALFDEKVISQKDELNLTFLVNKKAFETDKVKQAFEKTLSDICSGMLPLGGSVMRGHGCFTGTVKKNGEII